MTELPSDMARSRDAYASKKEKTSHMFPLNPEYNPSLRKSEKYQVKFAHHNRLRDSAIPALQRLLNEDSQSQ